MYRKFSEVWLCRFRDMQANRHTDMQTDIQLSSLQLHTPTGGEVLTTLPTDLVYYVTTFLSIKKHSLKLETTQC